MRWILSLLFLTVSACTTSGLKDNEGNSNRIPSSVEVVECYHKGTHAFNGRRLLALNRIVSMQRNRLEDRPNTQSQKLQINELNKIAEAIKYPSVDARWHPDQITEVLETQSKNLLEIMKSDTNPDSKELENISYLQTQYGPNLKNPDYWCPERKRNGTSEPEPSKSGAQ